MKCGLIGLPNVGKSTIFSALTRASSEVGNFPFTTTTAHHAHAAIPDQRLDNIASLIGSAKKVTAQIDITDIPGLTHGASQGEGLGNRFLAHIRETTVLVHILRCFVDENIVHVDGDVDPIRDMKSVEFELILADLQVLEKRSEKLQKDRRVSKESRADADKELGIIEEFKGILENEQMLYSEELSPEQHQYIKMMQLLTGKPVIYVCNVSELPTETEQELYQKLAQYIEDRQGTVVSISGRLEAELSDLESPEEEKAFLAEIGYTESGLHRVLRECYQLLKLGTFFTAGPQEARAWSYPHGYTAAEAAGIIHSDFERGFIRAEVYGYDDLLSYETEQEIRRQGKLRLEGKEYIVRDGDVIFFRFNV